MIRKLRQMRSRLVTGSVLLVLLLAVASTCRPKTTAVSTGSDNGVKPQSAAATPDASQSPSVNGTVPRPVARRPTRATQVEQTAPSRQSIRQHKLMCDRSPLKPVHRWDTDK